MAGDDSDEPQSRVSFVHFTIQNVDFSTNLELYDIDNPSKVVLRPPTPDTLPQWQLVTPSSVPTNTNNRTFNILNAATGSLPIPLYLTATPSAQSTNDALNLSCAPGPNPQIWTTKLFNIKGSSVYSITCPIQGSIAFLAVDENGKLSCEKDTILTQNQLDLKRNHQWRIMEVSAPLISGTYTLRNLNGNGLHIKPGGQVSNEKANKGAHEKWAVQCYGNGKCTIQNVKEKLYLGWEEQTGQVVLKAEEAPRRRFGLSEMITMDHVVSNQIIRRLLLSWQDDNQVIIKSSKIAHNRVWIFESANQASLGIAKVPAPIIFVPTRDREINSGV